MASLSGKKSTGENNWDYYVVRSKNLELKIEKGSDAKLYDKINDKLVPTENSVPTGTTITVLDVSLISHGSSQFALCKGADFCGYISISKLRKPTKAGILGTLVHEDRAISDINDSLPKNKNITLNLLDSSGKVFKTLKGKIWAEKVQGTPKADFVICSKDEKVYISHKAGHGPKAFQQYSGVSESSGEYINSHKEVQSFLKKISKNIGSNGLTSPCMVVVKDENLISCAIFGPDYGTEYGINNVHMVAQGNPILKNGKTNEYFLNWSDGCVINGDVDKFIGEYKPVLSATFRNGRSFVMNGKRYSGVRVSIAPKAMMQGRTGLINFK